MFWLPTNTAGPLLLLLTFLQNHIRSHCQGYFHRLYPLTAMGSMPVAYPQPLYPVPAPDKTEVIVFGKPGDHYHHHHHHHHHKHGHDHKHDRDQSHDHKQGHNHRRNQHKHGQARVHGHRFGLYRPGGGGNPFRHLSHGVNGYLADPPYEPEVEPYTPSPKPKQYPFHKAKKIEHEVVERQVQLGIHHFGRDVFQDNEPSMSAVTYLHEDGDVITVGNDDPHLSIGRPWRLGNDEDYSEEEDDHYTSKFSRGVTHTRGSSRGMSGRGGFSGRPALTPAHRYRASIGKFDEVWNIPIYDDY